MREGTKGTTKMERRLPSIFRGLLNRENSAQRDDDFPDNFYKDESCITASFY
jgi:hypothetical protein